MKKLSVLFLAASLLFGAVNTANAIEFKIKGSFQFAFDYVNGGNFMGKTRTGSNVIGQQWAAIHQQRDSFEAVQRLHLQMDAVASETLSGTVFFEIGEQRWGMASQGGALGTDGNMVKLKQAYIDWMVPNTTLKVRMGMQGVELPGFALESPVLDDDVAGITLSYGVNDNVDVTAMWVRPYNDNYADNYGVDHSGFMDNMDLFVLSVPIHMDKFKITPWVMGGAMGPNTGRGDGEDGKISFANPSVGGQAIDGLSMRDGLAPIAFSSSRSAIWPDEYASLFWGGVTAQFDFLSPLRIKADFIYGAVDYGRSELNRHGWFGMLLAEYAFDWVTPGIYGWYFSGDDGNPNNGSERMPYVATTNNVANSLSSFGYRGNPIMGGGKGVLGVNPNGTWGVGFRLKDMTFLEDLKHTFRFNFFGGTNDTEMASYITGRRTTDGNRTVYRNNGNNTDFNTFGTYLTTADTGIELNLDSTYQMYDNLKFVLEVGYIHLWLDKDVWGRYGNLPGDTLNYKDAWKASMNVIYSF